MEWLGEVPEHWGAGSVRWLARRFSGGTPDKTNVTYWEGGTIPWLNSGAVNDRLIKEPSTYITEEAFQNSSAKWIPERALVMALAGQGKTKGMVAQLAVPMTCNQSMAAIIPGPEIDARFLFWWLESNYQNIRNMAGGDLRDGLNLELLGNIHCPIPSPAEQTLIAAFLDRETAKIDELVAEQQRLIDLLKEKRQAVISHTITKGLNPKAPMKPSGIEWLGDVPAHWRFPKIGYHAEVTKLTGFEYTNHWKVEPEGDIVALRGFNIGQRELNLEKTERISRELSNLLSRSKLHCGDIVLPCTGTLGTAAVIEEDEKFHINQNIAKVSLDESIVPHFAVYWFTSGIFKSVLEHNNMSGMQPVLLIGDIRRIFIPLPPIEEEQAIVRFLNFATEKFDRLIAETQRAIDLLQERRTALISAAVTGQIDVRQFTDKESA